MSGILFSVFSAEKDDQNCEISRSHIIKETTDKNVGEELGLGSPSSFFSDIKQLPL